MSRKWPPSLNPIAAHSSTRWSATKGDDAGFVVKDYGGGLLMLKKRTLSGRSLFFILDGEERTGLILLLAYKKEGNEAPARLIAVARERMTRVLASRGKQ